MTDVTLQLPDEVLEQARSLAGGAENLQDFLVEAIVQEVQRHQPSSTKPDFWESLQRIRQQMAEEGIEVNPDEVWGDLRDKSVGREVDL
jgi:hypothetical protein